MDNVIGNRAWTDWLTPLQMQKRTSLRQLGVNLGESATQESTSVTQPSGCACVKRNLNIYFIWVYVGGYWFIQIPTGLYTVMMKRI